MRGTARRVEVETVEELDARLAGGARRLSGWCLQGLGLRERGAALLATDLCGAVLLSCGLADGDGSAMREAGALVFPTDPGAPIDAYRGSLYSPDELYAGLEHGYPATLDARRSGSSGAVSSG